MDLETKTLVLVRRGFLENSFKMITALLIKTDRFNDEPKFYLMYGDDDEWKSHTVWHIREGNEARTPLMKRVYRYMVDNWQWLKSGQIITIDAFMDEKE